MILASQSLLTLICCTDEQLDIKHSYTCRTIKTMYKIDDRAWIREDTLTMLLANARLKHLQKTHMGMKWYNSNGAMG